jgi:hypothetical protein
MYQFRMVLVLPLVIGLVCVVAEPLRAVGQDASAVISQKPLSRNHESVFRLRETNRFGRIEPLDHPEAWATITGLSTGPSNGVLFVDQRSQYAGLITPDGGVVAHYSRGEGSGPGEFRGMDSAIWDGASKVYVSDRINTRIAVFSASGEYLDSIQSSTIVSKIMAGSTEAIWVRPWMNTSLDLMQLISTEDGKRLMEIGRHFDEEPWAGTLRSDPAVCRSPQGFCLVPPYPYVVHEYSMDGRLVRKFGRVADWLLPPEKFDAGMYGEIAILPGGRVLDVAYLVDGMTVVLLQRSEIIGYSERGLPRFKSDYVIDFFDSRGTWVTSVSATDLTQHEDAVILNVAGSTDGALWISERKDYDYVVRFEFVPDESAQVPDWQ